MNENCFNCRFWKKKSPDNDMDGGYCRRYPPVLNGSVVDEEVSESAPESKVETAIEKANVDWSWAFPMTLQDDWCGEFRPVPPVVPEKTDESKWNEFWQGLDTRVRKSLRRSYDGGQDSIDSFQKLLAKTGVDLLERRNFGLWSLRNVRRSLAEIGFKLKGD